MFKDMQNVICITNRHLLNDDMSQMGIATYHITSLTGKPEFTSAYAQTRLHASVKNIVKAKAEAKAGALAPSMTTQIDNISTNVADAYIIHAEGNEAEVNTDEIFTNLAAAFTLMSGTEDMCNSMLKDLAPYGVAGRENKTNDLSLAINLPASLKLASDGWSTYCSTQKLDISQTSGLNAYIVSLSSSTNSSVFIFKLERCRYDRRSSITSVQLAGKTSRILLRDVSHIPGRYKDFLDAYK